MLVEEDCTIGKAEALRERLFDAISKTKGGAIHLDLSAVGRADVALVQLLVSADRTARGARTRLSLAASPAVADVLERAGLAGWPDAAAD